MWVGTTGKGERERERTTKVNIEKSKILGRERNRRAYEGNIKNRKGEVAVMTEKRESSGQCVHGSGRGRVFLKRIA